MSTIPIKIVIKQASPSKEVFLWNLDSIGKPKLFHRIKETGTRTIPANNIRQSITTAIAVLILPNP